MCLRARPSNDLLYECDAVRNGTGPCEGLAFYHMPNHWALSPPRSQKRLGLSLRDRYKGLCARIRGRFRGKPGKGPMGDVGKTSFSHRRSALDPSAPAFREMSQPTASDHGPESEHPAHDLPVTPFTSRITKEAPAAQQTPTPQLLKLTGGIPTRAQPPGQEVEAGFSEGMLTFGGHSVEREHWMGECYVGEGEGERVRFKGDEPAGMNEGKKRVGGAKDECCPGTCCEVQSCRGRGRIRSVMQGDEEEDENQA